MGAEEVAVLPRWVRLDLEPNTLSGSQRVEPVHVQVGEVHEHVRLDLIGTDGAPTVLVAPPDTHAIDDPHQRTLPREVVRWWIGSRESERRESVDADESDEQLAIGTAQETFWHGLARR